MKTTIISLALVSIFAIGNINIASAKNKIYKNVIENKVENSTTISFYDGENDQDLKPIKQYVIKYTAEGNPIEKIQYKWNSNKKVWETTDKYSYVYDTKGRLESLAHAEWSEKKHTWSESSNCPIYLLDLDKELLSHNEESF